MAKDSSTTITKEPQIVDRTAAYLPVPTATLIVNSVVPFQLFTLIGGNHVLYREDGATFDSARRRNLTRQDIHTLYVRAEEEGIYNRYLQSNILRLVQSDDPDCPEALERFYQTSNMVTRQFLHDPSSEECAQTARNVVGASLDRIDEAGSVLSYVNKLMSEIPDLYTHSLHVSLYGLAMARGMGMSDRDELGDFGLGLMLHDAGKTRLPVDEFDHDGPMTDSQRQLMYTHPALGLECVGDNSVVGPVARDVILNHHELLDGSGYPNGINDVSMYAQIAGIVNHFDRRTTATVFREATAGVEVIRNMIVTGRNKWDPKLLAALVRLMAN